LFEKILFQTAKLLHFLKLIVVTQGGGEADDDDVYQFVPVHNVDTLWTDFLENRIFAAFRRENARSVRKVTDFVDRH
jgi:hypothetical protein